MNTASIKKVMNDILPINEKVWDEFEAYFTPRTIKKGEILLEIGEVCRHVIFINKGLIRCFYYSHGDSREVTGQFFQENCFLTDYYSFISQKPSFTGFEALEETEIISIPRPAIYHMYDTHHSCERFGRLIAEQSYVEMHDSAVQEKTMSPEERYLKLIEERHSILQRVPLNLIASYLRITPEHLSRIRKKVSLKPVKKASGLRKVA